MQKGFTLSELLLSLFIVGVVAVLSVPVLLNNVNNKTFATQIKNMSATIEQLAQDQMVLHKTRDLNNTDFADPETLVNDNNFLIVKSCTNPTSDDSIKNCWKTKSGVEGRVKYKKLSGGDYSSTQGGLPTLETARRGSSAILKNGATIKYMLASSTSISNVPEDVIGYFVVDVNGSDKPNIIGRDLFGFYITRKGKVIGGGIETPSHTTLGWKKSHCRGEDNSNSIKVREAWCYEYLLSNSWNMDY